MSQAWDSDTPVNHQRVNCPYYQELAQSHYYSLKMTCPSSCNLLTWYQVLHAGTCPSKCITNVQEVKRSAHTHIRSAHWWSVCQISWKSPKSGNLARMQSLSCWCTAPDSKMDCQLLCVNVQPFFSRHMLSVFVIAWPVSLMRNCHYLLMHQVWNMHSLCNIITKCTNTHICLYW